MARQADHANVMREVFAAKLRAQAQILRFGQQFLLKLHVPERLTVFVTFRWQAIVVFG